MRRETLSATLRRFIVPDYERIHETHTILAGTGAMEPGMVLAKDSENGDKLVLVDSASETASIQTPFGVMANSPNAAGSDAAGLVFVKGYFHESGLIFGGTDTADDHRDALRALGIYINKNLGV